MKFIIFGTGGIDGFYGGMVACCGHEVVFVAKGKKLKAMKED
jgi:2-dehydropantoate 2-reductase